MLIVFPDMPRSKSAPMADDFLLSQRFHPDVLLDVFSSLKYIRYRISYQACFLKCKYNTYLPCHSLPSSREASMKSASTGLTFVYCFKQCVH